MPHRHKRKIHYLHEKIKHSKALELTVNESLVAGYVKGTIQSIHYKKHKYTFEKKEFLLKSIEHTTELQDIVKNISIKAVKLHTGKNILPSKKKVYTREQQVQKDIPKYDVVNDTYEVLITPKHKTYVIKRLKEIGVNLTYTGTSTVKAQHYAKFTAEIHSSKTITQLLGGDGGAGDE